MRRQGEMGQARIDRQAAKVVRLSRELRFELLLLKRMRARAGKRASGQDALPAFASLAEVYAAAIARHEGMSGD